MSDISFIFNILDEYVLSISNFLVWLTHHILFLFLFLVPYPASRFRNDTCFWVGRVFMTHWLYTHYGFFLLYFNHLIMRFQSRNMSNNLSVFIIKIHTFVITARCIDKVLFIEHSYRIYFAFSFSNRLTRLSRGNVSVLYKTSSQIYLLFWITHVKNRLWFFCFF